jgi:hypothetical protein
LVVYRGTEQSINTPVPNNKKRKIKDWTFHFLFLILAHNSLVLINIIKGEYSIDFIPFLRIKILDNLFIQPQNLYSFFKILNNNLMEIKLNILFYIAIGYNPFSNFFKRRNIACNPVKILII